MRNHPQSAMIFAAGLGTRMRALRQDLPKPLIPLAGRPLIDHALDLTEAAGVPRTVVNVHHMADLVEDHLSDRPGVVISDERSELLDTGGGLKAARDLLGHGAVYTINSDAAWSDPGALRILRDAWAPERMDALLLFAEPTRAHGHSGTGDFALLPDGRIARGGPLIYTGAQIIDPAPLAEIPDRVFSLRRLWETLASENRLFGVVYPGHWADAGTPEGLAAADAMLREAR